MPMFLSKLSLKRNGRPNRFENGFSLLELLVAMGIFAVIAAATVSIVVLLNNSAAKFQNTTTTQNELNTAMNRIQVDISQATSLDSGAKNYISLNSTQNAGTAYKTYIFYYDGTTDNIPDGANTDNLPSSNKVKGAIIEQVFQGTTFKSQNILVGGYQPSSSWKTFFQFYSANGTQYGKTGDKLSSDDLSEIVKIQFSLQSKVADRTTPVELASAAAINSYVQGLSYTGNQPQVPAATVLSGTLTYADNNSLTFDGTVTGNLTWNAVPGADSYTIYRINGPNTDKRTVILDPQQTTWSESGLTYGETYVYYITVNGASGQSVESNHWSMTVRPPKTAIINQNTLKQLADVKPDTNAETGDVSGSTVLPGYKYTVARDLTNQITWAPSHGATGYRVYNNGQLVTDVQVNNAAPANSYTVTDTGASVTYGAVNTYSVVPYNTGENNTGGSGVSTDSATLVSPPTAPVISANQSNASSGNIYNTVNTVAPGTSAAGSAYVKGNYLYTHGVNHDQSLTCTASASNRSTNTNGVSKTGATFDSNGSVQDNVSFGQSNCYQATAYNDAGESPFSNAVVTETRPGDFSITNKNVNASLSDNGSNGELYTVARGLTNQISWTGSAGASGYYVYRDGNLVTTINTGGTHSWQDTNVTYGDTHTYTVTAFTTWGGDAPGQRTTDASNDASATLVSPPVAPTISASAYGSDSGNPYNTVTLTNTVANADGYRLYRNTDTNSVPDCGSNLTYTNQNFGTNQGSQINNSVDWGSATCYRARAYNAAGDGPWSNIPTVYVGPAGFDLQNTGALGRNINLTDTSNGYRYTVAKNLTDQVSWNYTSGAKSYNIIRDNSNVANVNSGTSFWSENHNYGDQSTYYVQAVSSWTGTNFTITRNTYSSKLLNSVPKAATITASANDNNNGNSATSFNTVQTTAYGSGAPTTDMAYYGWSSGNATTGCGSGGTTWSSGNTTSNPVYTTVNWGTSSCYFAYPWNDAGQGQQSNTNTSAKQKPGNFSLSRGNNYKYLNINATYSSTTTCTGDGGKGSVDYCYATTGTDDFQHEHFDGTTFTSNGVKYRNVSSSLEYDFDWTAAAGAGVRPGDSSNSVYNVSYNEDDCADRSQTLDVSQPITSAMGTDLAETSFTPGCAYTAYITAYAPNGQTRVYTTASFATSPDVPVSANNYILRINQVDSTTNWGRRLQDVRRNTSRGDANLGSLNVYNESVWTNGSRNGDDAQNNASISAGDDLSVWSSAAHPTNDGNLTTNSYSWSLLTYNGSDYQSLKLKFKGSIGQGACTSGCGSSWGTSASNPAAATYLPEGSYTDGYHPRYSSAD